ncbi:MAG: hypothetical protein O7G85_05410 [Planctomycetota bacterium]|nr:hypothetical protein [Planctomycetota bacterium]
MKTNTTRSASDSKPSPLAIVLGLLLTLLATPALQAQCRYSWEIIDGPFCPSEGGPEAFTGKTLDEDGNAAGFNQCFLALKASSWSGSGEAPHLTGPPSVGDSFAHGMIDLDHIVGEAAQLSNGMDIAAYWEFGQGRLLDLLPGTNTSTAYGINSSGLIVGLNYDNIFGPLHAVLWVNDQPIVLALPIGPNSSASDINELGQITGWMGEPATRLAFLYDDGVVTTIPLLPNGVSTDGAAINNLGHVAGRGVVDVTGIGLTNHALFWDGTNSIDLGTLPGHEKSYATDLNDAEQIVGYSRGDNGNEAVLWQDGQMYRLVDLLEPPLGLGNTIAHAINNRGQIILDEGTTVRLTPIDSPPGDTDNNCVVNVDDLLCVLTEWGNSISIADVNDDGIVNVLDLLQVLADWG